MIHVNADAGGAGRSILNQRPVPPALLRDLRGHPQFQRDRQCAVGVSAVRSEEPPPVGDALQNMCPVIGGGGRLRLLELVVHAESLLQRRWSRHRGLGRDAPNAHVVFGDHPWGRSHPRASGQMVARCRARAGGEVDAVVLAEPVQPMHRERQAPLSSSATAQLILTESECSSGGSDRPSSSDPVRLRGTNAAFRISRGGVPFAKVSARCKVDRNVPHRPGVRRHPAVCGTCTVLAVLPSG